MPRPPEAQPPTPPRQAASSSQSRASPSTSAATTTKEPAKANGASASSPNSPAPAVLTLTDSSSDDDHVNRDAERMSVEGRARSPSAAKHADVNPKGVKRKGKDAPASAQPAAKKSKASSESKDKTIDDKDGHKAKALVELKNNRLESKQKPLQINMTMSYLGEMAAFLDYAVKHLSSSSSVQLDSYPEAHHPLVAKLIHESPLTLDGVFRHIKRTLAAAIAGGISSLADSQDELDEGAVAARIPTAPLKALIQALATRTNYGLAANDIDDLPEGVPGVPAPLQIWSWEVKREEHWCSELRAKLERRKRDREEIKSTAIALFHALSDDEQAAVLSAAADAKGGAKGGAGGKSKGKADADEADAEGASAGKMAKGKAKAKSQGVKTEEGEGDEGGDKPKGAKKRKELTEDEKREAEEKVRVKAEKDAEREAKRKEREEKRAKKAEEDAKKLERKAEKDRAKAEKDRAKAEKEEEERKKLQAKKKQTNMFTNFFVKPTTSPAPEEAGPSDPPQPGKAQESDFDRVFHPFTVREKVTLAPVNRFRKADSPYVDVKINSVPHLTLKDSLTSFLATASPHRIPPYDPHPTPPVSVRQCVVAINDSTLTSQDASAFYKLLEDRNKVRVKLFKFATDVRPGYIGTWTKTSHVVGPRTPFARETALLNYDVDSEVEWEEEADDPDAEDVGSDGARSDDEGGAESEADSWLAEDDEIEYEAGYDADGDVVMLSAEGQAPDDDEDVIVVEGDKERRKRERDSKKKKAERERRKKEREARKGPMLPVIKGACWQRDVEVVEDPVFKPMRIQFLNDAAFGLDPFTFVTKPFATPAATGPSASSTASAVKGKGKENIAIGGGTPVPCPPGKTVTSAGPPVASGAVNTLKAKRGPPKQPFPEAHLARFVHHVHGSTKTRPVLIDSFVDAMKADGITLNKNTVDAKWKELNPKRIKGMHTLAPEVLTHIGIPIDDV
ncbi:hypothetical protein JCM3770_000692 [Rhodotorula araucariae]